MDQHCLRHLVLLPFTGLTSTLAPEEFWGCLFLGMGLLRMSGVFSGWVWLRMAAALISSLIWCFVAFMLVSQNWQGIAGALYGSLTLFSLYIFGRLLSVKG